MSRFLPLLLACVFAAPPVVSAAVVGTNPPARPLTASLLATLPKEEEAAWQRYLARSKQRHAMDQAFLEEEMAKAGLSEQLVPPRGRAVSLRQPDAWYGSDEAGKMAVCVISFQTPAGGWNKNTRMTERPRLRGERFGFEEGYVGTFDNDATITELQFLAKVIAAGDSEAAAASRRAFGRGLEYIFAAQYPNGGWPQVWPLEGGYHDAITFNDGAMTHVLRFLRDVSEGKNEFAFVSGELRARAADSMNQGLACLLKAQITVKGKRTVWCQQYDLLTVEPTSARNYEMPSQSSGESADILTFLMEFEKPAPEVTAAVHSGAAWFKKTMIAGKVFKNTGEDGRRLVDATPDTQTWPRFAEIGSDRPLFGDRDRTIHDVVDEISRERRNGYAWYNGSGANLLKRYEKWAAKFPAK